MVLQVSAEEFLGEFDALGVGEAAGHGARVDGVEVAAGRQDIGAAPRGRARGAGRDALAVEGGEQPGGFAGGLTVDVEAGAELAFLDVADEAVDADDGLGGAGVRGEVEVGFDAGGLRLGADGGDQAVAAGRVEALGGRVFVEQAFEAEEGVGGGAGDLLRRDVAEGDRADAAFGLRGLAGVVDDEGVDDRGGADERFRPAGVGERDRLAGEPFERAVRAHVDQRVDVLGAQPEVERNVGVARGARCVVIVGVAGGGGAAFGLQRDQGLAAHQGGEVDVAVVDVGVGFGRAPCGGEIVAQGGGEVGEGRAVLGQRPCQALRGQRGERRAGGDGVAIFSEGLQGGLHAGQRIEPDRMGHLVGATGVGGEDQCHAAVRGRGGA